MSTNNCNPLYNNSKIDAEEIDKSIDFLYQQAIDTLPLGILKKLKDINENQGHDKLPQVSSLKADVVKNTPRNVKNKSKLRNMKQPKSSASVRRGLSVVEISTRSSLKLNSFKSMTNLDNIESFQKLGVPGRAKFWEKMAAKED